MTPSPSFHLETTSLDPGVTLIEASAGTGKTFTIAGLFLRLILERDLSVREILVVTFTEAATEELRDRIRRTLTDAVAALRHGTSPDSPAERLVRPHRDRAEEMLARLDRALSGFDEAPIFTIHGFCQRTLKDRAFESGVLFDTELLKDDTELLQELADDFWRQQFYETTKLNVSCALAAKLSPETFLELQREHNRHPQLKVLSSLAGRSLDEIAGELRREFDRAGTLWRTQRETILATLNDGEGWARGDHNKSDVNAEHVRLAGRCFAEDGPTPESLAALNHFAAASLEEDTKKNGTTPTHAFFTQCDVVNKYQANFVIALHLAFLEFAKAELPRRKQHRKIQTFDDLLTRLHAALHGPGGDALSLQLRQRYRAALIDEFQDTDPVQYQNFHRIFATAESRAIALLFLIGDPKQAIYGFRGADIFTYLDAARAADRRFTLDQNWRSESGLIHAVNTVFARSKAPFLFEAIPFKPVLAAGKADLTPLTEANSPAPQLHLWFVPREQDAKTIATSYGENELPKIVAGEIVRLLNSETRIGNRRLTPRDIAVLVRKKIQARWVQDALRELHVPAVLHTEESVFESHEATDLCRVLGALSRPQDERRIRAALVTDFLGWGGVELDQTVRDDQRWQSTLQEFHELHTRWIERGFTAMFRQWLHRSGVRQRLLTHEDGERRLTNLLHLGELIHQTAQERRLTPEPLVRWIEEQISAAERSAEEHQLRLERDDEAVRLVTIHKSKGLEYPIVFCPYLWGTVEAKGRRSSPIDPVFVHRQETDDTGETLSELICDFDSPDRDAHEALAFRERLAEDLRLLYVALTRARNRCYFVWGAFNKSGTSAAAWLLHPTIAADADLQSKMAAQFNAFTDAQLRVDLESLARAANTSREKPVIVAAEIPSAKSEIYIPVRDESPTLAAREFSGQIARDWRICSFSTLTANALDEAPDYDRADSTTAVVIAEEIEPTGIFAFPRGTAAGTCLHKLFEELNFAEPSRETIEQLVNETLREHGFSPTSFGSAVLDAVERTLDVPLADDRPDFTLRHVPNQDRLNELEFFFPIQQLSPALLAAGVQDFSTQPDLVTRLKRLNFKPANGFLKGFIDLVFAFDGKFYIVDWKSNWLGNRAEDYDRPAMDREMAAKYYTLQSLLYSVAVHQYLALRQPGYDFDLHFGGVFYLFVRGIDPSRPELGVHRQRPSRTLIENLSRVLQLGTAPSQT